VKIDDAQPPASDPEVNTEEVDSPQTSQSTQSSDQDEPSSFSKLLAKKRGGEQDSNPLKRGKGADNDINPASAMFASSGKVFESAISAGQVGGKQNVALPVELQQLVREISVVVNAAGNQQVNIEMNSNVLKGLHVHIERKEGVVAIQFDSTSDQVANLLIKNLESLSQGLADRGVGVAEIQVNGPRESSRARDFKGGSNSGGREQQGGRQGGGRSR